MKIKCFLVALLTSAFLAGWAFAWSDDNVAVLEVHSRVDSKVVDQVVEVALADLGIASGDSIVGRLAVFEMSTGLPVAFEWKDHSRDGILDQLIFLDTFQGGEIRHYVVREDPQTANARAFPKRVQAEISRKVGGEWDGSRYMGGQFQNVRSLTPPSQYTDHGHYIRYEGPGWESDRIGYRFYLDWRNGFDIFGKRTQAMVLQDVGQDGYDSYHEMADWGMDTLRVGPALGIGGFGAWRNNRLVKPEKVDQRTVNIHHNGHIYASFETIYEGWDINGNKFDLQAYLSIQAGSHLTKVDLKVEPRVNLATGLVKHSKAVRIEGNPIVPEKDYTYLATWGKQSIIDDYQGMAIFYRPRDLITLAEDEHNHLVALNARNGEVSYYFAAVWEQEPDSDWTKESFIEFLETTARQLNRAPLVYIQSLKDREQKEFPLTADSALKWTTRVADTLLQNRGDTLSFGQFDPESRNMARWRYTTGLLALGFEELGRKTGNRSYLDYAENTIGSFISDDGSIATYSLEEFNIDHLNPGTVVLRLFHRLEEPRYRKAADLLREQIRQHPRTASGGFWHKKIYPEQMWLDGLYMGAPFYAEYASIFGEPETFSDIALQFRLMAKYGYVAETGLFYHAYDDSRAQAWADPDSGLSSHAWGRALGWFAMALVDTMEFLPAESDAFKELHVILTQVAEMIHEHQEPSVGLWWQVMDRAGETGNYLEASASSMFVYALAKAVNKGWLTDDHFADVAIKGFEGIVHLFLRIDGNDGVSLDYICEVAGLSEQRDGSFDYYMSEPIVKHDAKGTGPFLLSGIQIYKLLKNRN